MDDIRKVVNQNLEMTFLKDIPVNIQHPQNPDADHIKLLQSMGAIITVNQAEAKIVFRNFLNLGVAPANQNTFTDRTWLWVEDLKKHFFINRNENPFQSSYVFYAPVYFRLGPNNSLPLAGQEMGLIACTREYFRIKDCIEQLGGRVVFEMGPNVSMIMTGMEDLDPQQVSQARAAGYEMTSFSDFIQNSTLFTRSRGISTFSGSEYTELTGTEIRLAVSDYQPFGSYLRRRHFRNFSGDLMMTIFNDIHTKLASIGYVKFWPLEPDYTYVTAENTIGHGGKEFNLELLMERVNFYEARNVSLRHYTINESVNFVSEHELTTEIVTGYCYLRTCDDLQLVILELFDTLAPVLQYHLSTCLLSVMYVQNTCVLLDSVGRCIMKCVQDVVQSRPVLRFAILSSLWKHVFGSVDASGWVRPGLPTFSRFEIVASPTENTEILIENGDSFGFFELGQQICSIFRNGNVWDFGAIGNQEERAQLEGMFAFLTQNHVRWTRINNGVMDIMRKIELRPNPVGALRKASKTFGMGFYCKICLNDVLSSSPTRKVGYINGVDIMGPNIKCYTCHSTTVFCKIVVFSRA